MQHIILLKNNRISGSSNNALGFEYGDEVVAHNGCAATLFGQFWYFGGGTGSAESVNPYKKQVSALLEKKRVGDNLKMLLTVLAIVTNFMSPT